MIISTDPAHSLGDALAEKLNGRPRQVVPGFGWKENGELQMVGLGGGYETTWESMGAKLIEKRCWEELLDWLYP